MRKIRVGTRASVLARTQTQRVADQLTRAEDLDVEIVALHTEGDLSPLPLTAFGGAGVFTGRLRSALLSGECDLVVHSLKDLPTASAEGIALAAVPLRADARDALCGANGLRRDQLPAGARVGTGSPRRVAQLRARRPDLRIVPIRGNIDTRLRRLNPDSDDPVDAIVLARAGLERIGRTEAITESLPLQDWPSAPGQGALAVETRADGVPESLQRALHGIDDPVSRATSHAERLVLAGLEAGCAAPLGASASVADDQLTLHASVYSVDGSQSVQSSYRSIISERSTAGYTAAAAQAAERVVSELLRQGAGDLVDRERQP